MNKEITKVLLGKLTNTTRVKKADKLLEQYHDINNNKLWYNNTRLPAYADPHIQAARNAEFQNRVFNADNNLDAISDKARPYMKSLQDVNKTYDANMHLIRNGIKDPELRKRLSKIDLQFTDDGETGNAGFYNPNEHAIFLRYGFHPNATAQHEIGHAIDYSTDQNKYVTNLRKWLGTTKARDNHRFMHELGNLYTEYRADKLSWDAVQNALKDRNPQLLKQIEQERNDKLKWGLAAYADRAIPSLAQPALALGGAGIGGVGGYMLGDAISKGLNLKRHGFWDRFLRYGSALGMGAGLGYLGYRQGGKLANNLIDKGYVPNMFKRLYPEKEQEIRDRYNQQNSVYNYAVQDGLDNRNAWYNQQNADRPIVHDEQGKPKLNPIII